MFGKKELPYPKESYKHDEYYVVEPSDLEQLEKTKVKVKLRGKVDSKPIIEYYKTSWPWDIGSRLIEEDHGHQTIISVDNVTVYLRGVVIVEVGEEVIVWGKLNRRNIQARRLETPRFDYRS